MWIRAATQVPFCSAIIYHIYKVYLQEYTGICISDKIIIHMLWTDDLYMVSCITDHAQCQLDGQSKFRAPNHMATNDIATKYIDFGKIKDVVKSKFSGKLLEQLYSYKCLCNIIFAAKTRDGGYIWRKLWKCMWKIKEIYLCDVEQSKKSQHTATFSFLCVPQSNTTDSFAW